MYMTIVYCIEYIWYRQGPYEIRIDTTADPIVPALDYTQIAQLQNQINYADKMCMDSKY